MREAQKTLAKNVTTLIHGTQAVKEALGNTNAFFSIKLDEELPNMSLENFEQHFENTTKTAITELNDVASLVVTLELRKTKADVRRVM